MSVVWPCGLREAAGEIESKPEAAREKGEVPDDVRQRRGGRRPRRERRRWW